MHGYYTYDTGDWLLGGGAATRQNGFFTMVYPGISGPIGEIVIDEAVQSASDLVVERLRERLGYSDAVISHVLGNKYPGDVARVLATVRGALMGETVLCPILGEIGRDRCFREQATPFAATNSTRARLSHACKTCPNRQQKDSP